MKSIKTYGKLKYNNKQWIMTEVQPHVCIKLKSIFPKISPYAAWPFKLQETDELCQDLLWFMDRYPLEINESDLGRLKRKKKRHIDSINDLEMIMMPDYKPQKAILLNGEKARNYQLVGCDALLSSKRLLIGDDIGLGKTLIGILSSMHLETRPVVIVVQAHLQKQWHDEIKWFTNLSVHNVKGTRPYALPPSDIYIVKYTCLRGWVNVFQNQGIKFVIFDEVQELRHNNTEKYKAAKNVSKMAEFCLGLSATPIYNYGNEIFNVMNVIKEGCLGTEHDFLREWTNGGLKKIVKDTKALGTYLRDNFLFLRRTRQEVGMELPQINKIIQHVPYDEHEVLKTQELARQLALKVISGSFVERGQAARDLDILARHNTGVAKARGVAQFVRLLLESGEPIVLCGWHREVYNIWLKELEEFKPKLYTGSESMSQKEATKQAFINGDTNLMILSLRSGIGLDGLQHKSSIIVMGELDWSPKVHDQVIGRLDRDGQPKQVTAIFCISECGSDPLIIDMLGLKASQSHGIVDPLTAAPEQYSDESRIKLLAKQYLKKQAEYDPSIKEILEKQE